MKEHNRRKNKEQEKGQGKKVERWKEGELAQEKGSGEKAWEKKRKGKKEWRVKERGKKGERKGEAKKKTKLTFQYIH